VAALAGCWVVAKRQGQATRGVGRSRAGRHGRRARIGRRACVSQHGCCLCCCRCRSRGSSDRSRSRRCQIVRRAGHGFCRGGRRHRRRAGGGGVVGLDRYRPRRAGQRHGCAAAVDAWQRRAGVREGGVYRGLKRRPRLVVLNGERPQWLEQAERALCLGRRRGGRGGGDDFGLAAGVGVCLGVVDRAGAVLSGGAGRGGQ
jgi:hypothetical protein